MISSWWTGSLTRQPITLKGKLHLYWCTELKQTLKIRIIFPTSPPPLWWHSHMETLPFWQLRCSLLFFFFSLSFFYTHENYMFLCKQLQYLGWYNTISENKLDQVIIKPDIGSPSENKREEIKLMTFFSSSYCTSSTPTFPFEGKKPRNAEFCPTCQSWPWGSLSKVLGQTGGLLSQP